MEVDILTRIETDLKNALKGGDAVRTSTFRLLLSALRNKAIEKRGGGREALTGEEALRILGEEAKRRKEAAEAFRKGNRPELARKEEAELAIINVYLPPKLGPEAIREVVRKVLGKIPRHEFGPVMQRVMEELRGRADGKKVREIVEEELTR